MMMPVHVLVEADGWFRTDAVVAGKANIEQTNQHSQGVCLKCLDKGRRMDFPKWIQCMPQERLVNT